MINDELNFIKIYSNNNQIKACLSCIPDDYDKYCEKILGHIIPLSNSIDIYYNDSNVIREENKNAYYDCLKEFDLFIIPISYTFLSNKSIARDVDALYAMKNNYPILPIIVEPGLEGIISKRFNGYHILDKAININNDNEYKQKLETLFNHIIPNNNTIQEINKLFTSSIFIINNSFDLNAVNKISKIIHESNKNITIYHCNNIINNNINSYAENTLINNSSAIILLISSNLTNYSNNDLFEKYNYAIQKSKPIIPILIDGSDTYKIKQKITNLTEIFNINKKEPFLKQVFKYCDPHKINSSPSILYNMGLAYLFSTNSERNVDFAIEQLEAAAASNYIPAIKLLSDIYSNGIFTNINYKKSIYYKNKELKILNNYDDEEILIALGELHFKNNDYYSARNYYIKCYKTVKNKLGESDLHTISIAHSLGKTYLKTNKYKKALSIFYKCYEMRKTLLSENHPDTLDSMLYLAITYNRLGQHEKTRETDEKIFNIMTSVYGKYNIKTLKSMDNLADDYFVLKNYKKSYEISTESYQIKKEKFGENDLETISPLRNIARIHYSNGDYYKSIELNEQIYSILINLFDVYHPQAVDALSNISKSYYKLQQYNKSKELGEQVLDIRKDMLGEMHPDTLNSLKDLVDIYEATGNHAGAVKLNEEYRRLHVASKNNYSIFLAIGLIILVYVILPIIVINLIIFFF